MRHGMQLCTNALYQPIILLHLDAGNELYVINYKGIDILVICEDIYSQM